MMRRSRERVEMNIEKLKVGDVEEHRWKTVAEGGDRARRPNTATERAVKGNDRERLPKAVMEHNGGRSRRRATEHGGGCRWWNGI